MMFLLPVALFILILLYWNEYWSKLNINIVYIWAVRQICDCILKCFHIGNNPPPLYFEQITNLTTYPKWGIIMVRGDVKPYVQTPTISSRISCSSY